MPPHQDPPTLLQLLEALSPQDREHVAEMLASYNWKAQRSRAIQDIRNNLTTRVLHNGNDVNTDAGGNQVGMTNTGRSQFPVINLVGGTASVNSATNGVQVDISFGGGADCMFDMLVSSCFATLSGFTEGQVFASLSGCTFKGYSTVQGAVATLDINSGHKVIYVCSGTYNENVHVGNTSGTDWIRIEGAGRDRTKIVGASSATSTFITNPAGNFEIAHLTIQGNGANNCFQNSASLTYLHDVTLAPQNGGTGAQFTSGERVHNVRIAGTSAATGWYTANPASTGPYIDAMDISGCAIGVNIQNGVAITMTDSTITGATTAGIQPGTCIGSTFSGITFMTCAKGINFSSTAGWVSVFTDLTFYHCTIGIDLSGSTLAGGNNGLRQCQFNDMMFVPSAGTDIGIKANGAAAVVYSQFSQLSFNGYNAGNEILGTSSFSTGTTVFHNTSNASTLADIGSVYGHAPGVGITTEHHVISAQVDNTSLTQPYQIVGPMSAAGTITGVEAVCGENKTCGLTSAIFDVAKILAANVNTDGVGTTIFTTVANRPTITNGNKKSTTTMPDVTAFAAGDYFTFWSVQTGTNLTVANVGVRYTVP